MAPLMFQELAVFRSTEERTASPGFGRNSTTDVWHVWGRVLLWTCGGLADFSHLLVMEKRVGRPQPRAGSFQTHKINQLGI